MTMLVARRRISQLLGFDALDAEPVDYPCAKFGADGSVRTMDAFTLARDGVL
jgi:hypothetical protein